MNSWNTDTLITSTMLIISMVQVFIKKPIVAHLINKVRVYECSKDPATEH